MKKTLIHNEEVCADIEDLKVVLEKILLHVQSEDVVVKRIRQEEGIKNLQDVLARMLCTLEDGVMTEEEKEMKMAINSALRGFVRFLYRRYEDFAKTE